MQIFKKEKGKIFRNGSFFVSVKSLAVLFFFAIFFLPDYFGISIGFAFNVQRIVLVILIIWIMNKSFRRKRFTHIIFSNKTLIPMCLYLFISGYTMAIRTDIGTFLNPFIDFSLVYFMSIYLLESEITIDELLRLIRLWGFVLCIIGFYEYFTGKLFFERFMLIPGMSSGHVYRDGHLRVMGPAHHPLGYGMFLLILFPIVCYDEKEDRIDLLLHPLFDAMVLLNVYFTGSRSTLGIFAVEIILLFFFSDKLGKQKAMILGTLGIAVMIILAILFFNTSIVQKILITGVTAIDGAFGTKLAVELFGYRSSSLDDSAIYRSLLPLILNPKVVYWLNPWLGKGNSYKFGWYYQGYAIASIDNFYVNQYIKLAYPGLAATIIWFLSNIRFIFLGAIRFKKGFYAMMLVITGVYLFNLWWADQLGTLDYMFVLFAMLYVQFTYDLRKTRERN